MRFLFLGCALFGPMEIGCAGGVPVRNQTSPARSATRREPGRQRRWGRLLCETLLPTGG